MFLPEKKTASKDFFHSRFCLVITKSNLGKQENTGLLLAPAATAEFTPCV